MIRDLHDPGAAGILARHYRYWRNGHGDDAPPDRARFAPAGDDDAPLFQMNPAAPMGDTATPYRLEPPPPLDVAAFRDRVERDFDAAGLLAGDYLRVVGTGIASEVLVGCTIMVSGGTNWAENCFTDVRQLDAWHVRDTVWFRRLVDNTKAAVDSVDDAAAYPFGSMAFRGPVDMAEAMMGGPALCELAIDDPAGLKHLLARITDVIIEVGRAHSGLLPRRDDGGQVSSYRIATPGTTITLTLDGACLFSPAHYQDLFLPFDRRVCDAFEAPFVHLHAAARQHFDSWAEIPNLGLQCVVDQAYLPEGRNQPIGPQIPELLADFQRLRQRASLMLYGYWSPDDLVTVRDHLPTSGCAITGMTQDPETLQRLLRRDPE